MSRAYYHQYYRASQCQFVFVWVLGVLVATHGNLFFTVELAILLVKFITSMNMVIMKVDGTKVCQ